MAVTARHRFTRALGHLLAALERVGAPGSPGHDQRRPVPATTLRVPACKLHKGASQRASPFVDDASQGARPCPPGELPTLALARELDASSAR